MPNPRSIRRPPHSLRAPNFIDDGWSLRSSSGLEILTATLFDSVPWVLHGFSTRGAGESRVNGVAALNLGFTDWDWRETVERNRSSFLRAIQGKKLPAKPNGNGSRVQRLVSLRQIHSDVVRVFSRAPVKLAQG